MRHVSKGLALALLASACIWQPAHARPGDFDCDPVFPGSELGVPQSGINYLLKLKQPQPSPAMIESIVSKARRMGVEMKVVRPAASGTTVVSLSGATPVGLRAMASTLSKDPRIVYLVEDQLFEPASIPNDPGFAQQWALYATPQGTGAINAWARSQTGNGTVVAVIDTGKTSHPDLDVNWVDGYDFISDAVSAGDQNGRDSDPTDEGTGAIGGCSARRASWHGTSVAGIIAAVGNNQTGIIGAAYGTKVMPLRVLGKQGGSRSDIVAAIRWAAGELIPDLPENTNPVEVINLSLKIASLSGTACEQPERDAIQFAISQGVVVVAGAGNDNLSASTVSPASCPGVIAVGASDQAGGKAGFSNYGPTVTLMAPGVNIYTTNNSSPFLPHAYNFDYKSLEGTSMSAPFVSAAAAMIQSINPRLPEEVKALLVATAKPLSSPCPSGCGAGILDIDKATWVAGGGPLAGFTSALVSGPKCPLSSTASYQLTNTSSDPDGNIVGYQWFQNGILFSTDSSPLVTNVSSATSMIRLVVTDATGLTNETTKELGWFRCLP